MYLLISWSCDFLLNLPCLLKTFPPFFFYCYPILCYRWKDEEKLREIGEIEREWGGAEYIIRE